MEAKEFSPFFVPTIMWLLGLMIGRFSREHNHDKRITALENCLNGRNGIYDSLDKINTQLENIASAVNARQHDVAFNGANKRHAQ